MSQERAQEVSEKGIREVYPKYFHQIALYARRMFELQMVSHPERGVFGIMDREGRMLPPERLTWETAEHTEILQKERDLVLEARAGRLPEQPFPQSSSECAYCPYYSLCWGSEAQPYDERGHKPAVEVKENSVLKAAQEWAEMKPRMDRARDMLQATSNSNGGADVIAEGVVGGYFQPQHERIYDTSELERMVPADILRKCLTDLKKKNRVFWVRMARR